jgi:hypothetical protein
MFVVLKQYEIIPYMYYQPHVVLMLPCSQYHVVLMLPCSQ